MKAYCRGMFRAERRRANRTDRWWKAANETSLPFRLKKVAKWIEDVKKKLAGSEPPPETPAA